MENNITNLFKAINFMNKKTLIPTFDDFIIIENGSFILQDAFKTYVFSFDILNNTCNCVISKADLLKLKTKNAKYFLESVNDEGLKIKIVTKDTENEAVLPTTKRFINMESIIKKEFLCTNCIETNGINLKSILNGYKDAISFKFDGDAVMVSMGSDSPFVDFNAEFGELCELNIIESNDSIAQIIGQNIVDAIGQFGLVKKNSTINIKFNSNCFVLSNTNLTIYIASNKL